MPKFIIEEKVPCVHVWTYEVEAATEEEAMELIQNSEVEVLDSNHEDYNYDETEWNVEEVDDDEDDEDGGVELIIKINK